MEIGRVFGFGHIKVHPDWPHGQNAVINRIYHIHSGKGFCRHNGKDYPFYPDHLYYIPGSDNLKMYTDSDDTIFHTYIDFDFFPPVVTNEILCAPITDDPFLQLAIKMFDETGKKAQNDRMVSYFHHYDESFKKLANGAVTYILSYILEHNGVPFINDKEILKALDIIHNRMHENITVELLANECYMNKDSFNRRFSRTVGVTPYAYLKRLRLLTARRLRENGMNFSEIATLTGYSDASSLIHALKYDS